MGSKRRGEMRQRGAVSPPQVHPDLPGQVVMVLQGGGALGAYQVGVYQALHEAGVEPQWVIGTSIGAINGSIIAGNPPEKRFAKLSEFWNRIEHQQEGSLGSPWRAVEAMFAKIRTVAQGVSGFFAPNPDAAWGPHMPVGIEGAAFYSTAPLKLTLADLIDFSYVNSGHMRLTVGAVKVCTGEMRYFDNREGAIGVEHVMASGALPPGFPAVRIDGEAYWDGGIYSNTPIEVVLEDHLRRDSLIFAVDVWHPHGPEPETIWQVLGRHKDIQYASRAKSHIARQKQIHGLRHVIHELAQLVPACDKDTAAVRDLIAYGCTTRMHVVRLLAPRLDGEDHTKDIDFTPTGIRARRQAGYADARKMLEATPWSRDADPLAGVLVHDVRPDG
ncbi:MAG: patatin-like phospholipase family protein [Betaproteobacteria bacterium]|nr:patatin-like phospholipase family protein [Betaproteobacteria bacterium]